MSFSFLPFVINEKPVIRTHNVVHTALQPTAAELDR
jgi:hypothetical protein